jgi:hypothetical protein
MKRYNQRRSRDPKVKRNPTFKRLRQKARDYPHRHERKRSPKEKSATAHLLDQAVPFGFQGAEPDTWAIGYIVGFDAETREIVFRMVEPETYEGRLKVADLLAAATFLSEEDIDLVFDLIDEHLGMEAYEDIEDDAWLKLALKGYKPTKSRRKKWRGTKRTKGRKYERSRKRSPKRKQYMKRYNQRRSRDPKVKRQRQRRRRNPARWKKRGSVLTTPEIAFVFGPDLHLGYVHSVSPLTGLVTFTVAERDVMQLQSLPVVVFLEVIVPLTEQDAEALFDLLEIEIGPEVYEDDITADDIMECAAMYGVDPDSREFREGCFELTGKEDLTTMSADERALVNGVLVTKTMEGGILNRSPEDDFIEDEGEPEEDDENFYYGKVDLPEDLLAKRVAHTYLLRLAWEGTNWQYDQEAPNVHDPIDHIPDRPHQPSSPTHQRWHQHQHKKTPAPGTHHHDHPSKDDAPGSSAKAPGGSYVSEGGAIGKTAATMHDIANRTDKAVHQRARKVSVRVKRADPGRGIWTFHAAGSEGRTYTIRIKGVRKGNLKDLRKAQLKCSCDCDFFRWQGPEHWAKANGYLYGKPVGTASKPDERDRKGRHWACKHLLAALNMASRFRLSGEGGGRWWPADIEAVPDFTTASAGRVVEQWLGSRSIPDRE